LAEDLNTLSERLNKEDFYKHTADFNSQLTHLKGRVRDAVIMLSDQQKLRLSVGVEDLQRIPEWDELTQEERGNAVSRLDGLVLAATQDLVGSKSCLLAITTSTARWKNSSVPSSGRARNACSSAWKKSGLSRAIRAPPSSPSRFRFQ
jgi:excinuclease UvrABC helicase subunit UvrB